MVAAGGDGTVNGVVTGLAEVGARCALGVLPVGTGNDLARSLGVPLDLEEALDVLDGATPVPMDLARLTRSPGESGRVGGGAAAEDGVAAKDGPAGGDRARHWWFANASAGGMSGRVDDALTPEIKAAWGPLAYLRSALDVVSDPRSWNVRVDAGEEGSWEGDALNVLVANGRTVAGGIPVAATARLDDGLLDVVVVRPAPLPALAAFASLCLVGKHLDHELVRHFRARRVEVGARPPMTFNVDGEPVGETPFRYEIRPGALRVLPGPEAPGLAGS